MIVQALTCATQSILNHFSSMLEWIPGVKWIKEYWRDNRLTEIARQFSLAMEKLAYEPSEKISKIPEILEAEKFLSQMSCCKRDSALEAKKKLNRLVVAQKIRFGIASQIKSHATLRKLEKLASTWKKNNNYIENKKLSDLDKKKIAEICEEPEFAALILKDSEWRAETWRWIIVNDSNVQKFTSNEIKPFMMFPYIVRSMFAFGQSMGGDLFRVEGKSKILQGRVEKLYYPYNREKIDLRGPWKEGFGKKSMTLEEIIKEADKTRKTGIGDIEVIGRKGFCLYNPVAWGSWNSDLKSYQGPKFEKPEDLRRLVSCAKLSHDQAIERYGKNLVNKGWPIPCLRATEKVSMAGKEMHTFYEFAFPAKKKCWKVIVGGYFIVPFILRPEGYPKWMGVVIKIFNHLLLLARYNVADLIIPDLNRNCTGRWHALVPLEARDENQIDALFRKIIKHRRSPFHYINFSCTGIVVRQTTETLDKESLPDLRVKFWSMKPVDEDSYVYGPLQYLPLYFRTVILNQLFRLFGSNTDLEVDGKIHNFYNETPAWGSDNALLQHPSRIFEEDKKRKAVLANQ